MLIETLLETVEKHPGSSRMQSQGLGDELCGARFFQQPENPRFDGCEYDLRLLIPVGQLMQVTDGFVYVHRDTFPGIALRVGKTPQTITAPSSSGLAMSSPSARRSSAMSRRNVSLNRLMSALCMTRFPPAPAHRISRSSPAQK